MSHSLLWWRCVWRYCLPSLIIISIAILGAGCPTALAEEGALPSWADGPSRESIIRFVVAATDPDSASFIPPENRIAVFDNDGTLWPEQPLIQLMFTRERLKSMADADPSLAERQPFKAALENDMEYFHTHGMEEALKVLGATHGGMDQQTFEAEVEEFFATQQHPTLKAPYTALAYAPMVELLEYLRANGFQTWICSGGGIDFIRAVSQTLYGVPPQQVIGSSLAKSFEENEGKPALIRSGTINSVNDKAGKPVNIDLHIGIRPVFAAGNVRSGGDIAMLQYSQGGAGPSFQMLVNHDDAAREFAYTEKDGKSLQAAGDNDWTVASMRDDWERIFAGDIKPEPVQ